MVDRTYKERVVPNAGLSVTGATKNYIRIRPTTRGIAIECRTIPPQLLGLIDHRMAVGPNAVKGDVFITVLFLSYLRWATTTYECLPLSS